MGIKENERDEKMILTMIGIPTTVAGLIVCYVGITTSNYGIVAVLGFIVFVIGCMCIFEEIPQKR